APPDRSRERQDPTPLRRTRPRGAPLAPPARAVGRPAAARRDRAGPRDGPRPDLRRRAHGQPRLPHGPRGPRAAAGREPRPRAVHRDGDARSDRGEPRRPRAVPRRRPRRRRQAPADARGDLGAHAPHRAGSGMSGISERLVFLRERGMGASVLVAALSSAFGVVLLATTGYIGFLATTSLGDGGTVVMMVALLSAIFIIIAMYVGAIVTANTFSTIVAGRTRQIALLRLIGATARPERRRVASQGLVVGILGAVVGLAAGALIAVVGTRIAGDAIGAPAYDAPIQPWMLIPPVAVVLTTWAAAWGGSRRVLSVTPREALG